MGRLDELLEDEFQRSGARSFERRRTDDEPIPEVEGDDDDELVESIFPGPVIDGAIGDMRDLLATVLVRLDHLEESVAAVRVPVGFGPEVDLSPVTALLARLDQLEDLVVNATVATPSTAPKAIDARPAVRELTGRIDKLEGDLGAVARDVELIAKGVRRLAVDRKSSSPDAPSSGGGVTGALGEQLEGLGDRLEAIEANTDRSARQTLQLRRSLDELLAALGYTASS